jgi:hypothetical protein
MFVFSTIEIIVSAENTMSMRIRTFGLVAALFATQCLAVEDDNAQSLYDQNCISCHGDEVYTREDRRVGSLAGLEAQVRRCDANLELRLFDEDISALTQLLNDRYYHFKP